MSRAPEPNAVDATKEESIFTEAARTIQSHVRAEADSNGDSILRTDKATIRFGG
ncbi:MAG: hypothetical protein H7Y30_11710, partial [Pyrinomonadaceae bacterium]|nr:hypothetical protein [Pyrinomonadaceae bacterium]